MSEKFKRERQSKGNNKRRSNTNGKSRVTTSAISSDKGIKCPDRRESNNSMNDTSWYTRYPDLVEPLAKVPFPNKPGMSINLGKVGYTQKEASGVVEKTATFSQKIPGIMTLSWYPIVGETDGPTSPVGLMAKEIYSKIRQQYSGSLDADAPDFVMYIYSLDSIYSYIGALKRIYRALDAYDKQNYFTPDGVLHAAGIKIEAAIELRKNKANFREAINQLIRMTDRFKVPSDLDLFVRHYWMNDHVYLDAPEKFGQMYMFREDAFYMYKELGTVTAPDVKAAGMELIDAPWTTLKANSVSELYDFGHNLITALSAWDDAYTISGYLMRAYADSPEFSIQLLTGEEVLELSYQPEVLMQIHNSFAIGTIANEESGLVRYYLNNPKVNQDPTTNTVHCSMRGKEGGYDMLDNYDQLVPFLNMATTDPDIADILIATRLKASVYRDADDWACWIAGTELPIAWFFTVRDWDGNWENVAYPCVANISRNPYISKSPSVGQSDTFRAIRAITLASHFDWAPLSIVVMYDYEVSGGTTLAYDPVINLYGDLRNLAALDNDILKELHRVCMLSELDSFR